MKQCWEKIPLGELVKKEKFSIVDGPFGTQLNKKELIKLLGKIGYNGKN